MTAEGPPPLYRRKYLLNARFQLKYTFVFIVLSSIVAGVLGARLYGTVRENSQLIAMDDTEANAAIQGQLKDQDRKVLYEIFAWLAGMVVVISTLGVLLTHKVAGPALVLTRNLNELAQGKIPKLRPLRKNDELTDLFEALHAAVTRIDKEVREETALLEKAAETAPEDVRPEIVKMVERLKAYYS
jgi:methyl-accepting chemotaxis protein